MSGGGGNRALPETLRNLDVDFVAPAKAGVHLQVGWITNCSCSSRFGPSMQVTCGRQRVNLKFGRNLDAIVINRVSRS
jgi:hypothetical protein